MSRLFLDSANLIEIQNCVDAGFISGVTTNPAILSKEPKANFIEHCNKIIELISPNLLHLSVEVFSRQKDEIIRQALDIDKKLCYWNLHIKIQIGKDELEAIKELQLYSELKINCTACMSVEQALIAANAGCKVVSLFFGRIRDYLNDEFEALQVIEDTRRILENSKLDTEIIVGSIRHKDDIKKVANAGAHIITANYKILSEMIEHPATTKVIDEFFTKFAAWQA